MSFVKASHAPCCYVLAVAWKDMQRIIFLGHIELYRLIQDDMFDAFNWVLGVLTHGQMLSPAYGLLSRISAAG